MAVNVVLKSVWDDKGVKGAESAFDNIGKTIGKLGGLIAGAFSVNALVEFTKAAAEDAKSAALLAEQLRNTVGANEEMIASVEESIKQMQLSAAVADDVLRPAFGQLVRATGDVGQAQRLMQIALDVSAATGRNLNTVTLALTKAYQGNEGALSRLGIKAQEGADVFGMLEEQFAGAAETAARNDPFQRLTIIFGELQEQIGQIFLPYLNEIADYFASADFQTAFTKMGVGVGEAVKQIDNLFRKLTGSTALTFFINLIDAAAVGLAQIAYVIGDVGNIIGKFLSGDFVGAYKAQATFLDRYNKFVKDIYDAQDRAAAAAGSVSADNRFTNLLNDIGGGGGGGGSKGKTPFEKVQGFIKQSQKSLAQAQDQYNKTIANAQKKYAEAVLKTETEFGQKLADIVQKSQDRLRTAFESVVRVSLADIFEVEETKSVANLVQGLTTRLAKSQALLEKAGKLNAAGFSQTFIEQVVEAGTDTGNELASAILESTPQTQAELQRLFLALEATAETGMDSLAREIYDKQGLATRELKNLYAQTQTELTEALKALQLDFNQEVIDANMTLISAVDKIREAFQENIDSMKGDLGGLGKVVDEFMKKLGKVETEAKARVDAVTTPGATGGAVTGGMTGISMAASAVTDATGIFIDSMSDVTRVINYLQERINAANEFANQSAIAGRTAEAMSAVNLRNQFRSQLGLIQTLGTGAVGTTININVKTDSTQSLAMVGKTLGNTITKYVSAGGQVLVSPTN
jgi:tetratricopeptide (TPR) repeat protein